MRRASRSARSSVQARRDGSGAPGALAGSAPAADRGGEAPGKDSDALALPAVPGFPRRPRRDRPRRPSGAGVGRAHVAGLRPAGGGARPHDHRGPRDAARRPSAGCCARTPARAGSSTPSGAMAQFRIAKVSGSVARCRCRPRAWPTVIQDEIDDPKEPNTSGLVAIDEIGNALNDGRVRISYASKRVRGKRIRVASYNRLVVTKNGWRIVERPRPAAGHRPRRPRPPRSRRRMEHPRRASPTRAAATTPSACTSTSRRRSCHLDRPGPRPAPPPGQRRQAAPRHLARRDAGARPRRRRLARDVPLTRARPGVTPATAAEWRAAPGVFSRYAGPLPRGPVAAALA